MYRKKRKWTESEAESNHESEGESEDESEGESEDEVEVKAKKPTQRNRPVLRDSEGNFFKTESFNAIGFRLALII